MSLFKTVKTETEILKFFTEPILGSEKVMLGDKIYYLMKEKIKFNKKDITRKDSDDVDVFNLRKKLCTNCKTEKPITDFYRDSSTKLGFSNRCKQCWKLINEKKKKGLL